LKDITAQLLMSFGIDVSGEDILNRDYMIVAGFLRVDIKPKATDVT